MALLAWRYATVCRLGRGHATRPMPQGRLGGDHVTRPTLQGRLGKDHATRPMLQGGVSRLVAQGGVIDADTAMRAWRRRKAQCDSCIAHLQHAARPMMEEDRQKFLDDMVMQSNAALARGDMRTGCVVVRGVGRGLLPAEPAAVQEGRRAHHLAAGG